MNMELFWKLFIEKLRDRERHLRRILSHDGRAATIGEIADAAEAAMKIVEQQRKPRDQWRDNGR